jgi:hypothetical protein
MVIILVAVDGYSIGGCWCLLISIILMAIMDILLLDIGG